jgi:hypothetical protein
MSSVVPHPYRALMAEAQRERELADSPQGQALLDEVFKAVRAYSDFLDEHGLIWDEGRPGSLGRLKASALVITVDYGGYQDIDVRLKDGALDRVYGSGTNPDPEGAGPADIPHKECGDD